MAEHIQQDGPSALAPIVAQTEPAGIEVVAPQSGLAEFTRRVVVTVVILAVAYLLWRGVDVLLETFAGVLFAVFLNALASRLQRHAGLSYRWSLAIVVVALLLLAAGLGWLISWRLSSQIKELTRDLPRSFEQLKVYLENSFPFGNYLVNQAVAKAPEAAGRLAGVGAFTRATGLIGGVAEFLVAIVVILFVGLFGAVEPDLYRQGLLHLVPLRHRSRVHATLDALAYNLRWWLLGQVFLMIVIGATTTVGLWLLGIPLALTLGLIAGLLEIIPYVGPWLSAVPAVMIALTLSPGHVLLVLGLYLALHILEGYVLLPLVQRRVVQLPPALTLMTQVLLGALLGLMGLFVAAPLTVCAVVVLKMLYVEDTLGDQSVIVPGEPGSGKVAANGAAARPGG